MQVNGLRRDRDAPRFDACEIENIVDQAQQMLSQLRDLLELQQELVLVTIRPAQGDLFT